MHPLLHLSATELAHRIRHREVRSSDVVAAHIEHARVVNPTLNAIVMDRFDEAMDEARQADAALEAGRDVGPLHGVPCTIKESYEVKGMPNSTGLVTRAHLRSERDAITVTRLRDAGAIVLGVTNTSELCMWMESDNRVWGRTNNPYDPTRIVGGSSGGEGAIVGSGASPFGLGSDIGGSIRMPAFFNGVYGHKPSPGAVPASGQYPPAEPEQLAILASGPIARRAADLMPILRLVAGRDEGDVTSRDVRWPDPESVDLSRLRFISVIGNGLRKVHPDLVAAQRRAARVLTTLGADVEERSIPELRYALTVWSARMAAGEGLSYAELLGEGRRVSVRRELPKMLRRQSAFTAPSLGLALVERLDWLTAPAPERLQEQQSAMQDAVERLLQDDGLLLFPSYTRPAPKHNAPMWTPIDWIYTATFNALQLPVTQVPLGLNAEGLPLGMQIVGRRDDDHRTIAAAMALERAMGGWVPPARWDRRGA
jgi:fatty acid amide hydrolase 2